MRRLACAVCLGLCLATTPAHAAGEFERYFAAALRLYEALQYEDALDELAKAKKYSRGPDDDVAVALYAGILRSELHQDADAADAFRVSLFLNPDVALPPAAAPKVKATFELLRTKVKRELASRSVKPPVVAEREVVPVAPSRSRGWAWIPVGAGIALAGGGAWFLNQANTDYQRLAHQAVLEPGTPAQLRDSGKLDQILGVAGLVAGGLAVAGGAALLILGGGGREAVASVQVGPAGARLTLSGTFP